MRTIRSIVLCVALWLLVMASVAGAVPDSVGVRAVDVTPSSCALVWLTDVAATPHVEVYGDPSMTTRLTGEVTVTPFPDLSPEAAEAARRKGIMKVRIAGLAPATTYYLRGVTPDPANPASIGYAPLHQVQTAASVKPYRRAADGTLHGFGNDLLAVKTYVRPGDTEGLPGLGDLVLMETPGSPYPVSAFVGTGIATPSGVLDLNNLFDRDALSMVLSGGEKALLTVYRGGALATLIHYRRIPVSEETTAVGEPVMGFFADINLDGRIDDADFEEFRKQYRTAPNDSAYNPDYDLADDGTGIVDAHDFARFAREYGRTNVP